MSEEETSRRKVSYSQYSMWANCPMQWKLRYVDGHKGDSGIALVFGKAMHETIQHWLGILYNDTPLKARTFDMNEYLKEQMKTLAKAELIDGEKVLTTKDELIEHYLDGCNILEHVRKYAKDWFPQNYEFIGVEIPLEIDLENNIKFTGFIDVVLRHKATKMIYIYDFKTSTRGWTYHKKDVKKTDQLLLYKKFYSQKFGVLEDNIKVEFIILKRKIAENSEFVSKHVVGFEPASGSPSMKKANERFSKFLTDTFAEDGSVKVNEIKATPSESACKFCPYNKDLCPDSFYMRGKKSADK